MSAKRAGVSTTAEVPISTTAETVHINQNVTFGT